MHFGEYLAQCGAISYKQLLDALSTQYHMQRFAPQVATELNFLSSKEATRLLNLAMKEHGELTSISAEKFIAIARREMCLTAEQAQQLRTKCNREKMTIGKVLLQSGALDEANINELLREYMAIESTPASASL